MEGRWRRDVEGVRRAVVRVRPGVVRQGEGREGVAGQGREGGGLRRYGGDLATLRAPVGRWWGSHRASILPRWVR